MSLTNRNTMNYSAVQTNTVSGRPNNSQVSLSNGGGATDGMTSFVFGYAAF